MNENDRNTARPGARNGWIEYGWALGQGSYKQTGSISPHFGGLRVITSLMKIRGYSGAASDRDCGPVRRTQYGSVF